MVNPWKLNLNKYHRTIYSSIFVTKQPLGKSPRRLCVFQKKDLWWFLVKIVCVKHDSAFTTRFPFFTHNTHTHTKLTTIYNFWKLNHSLFGAFVSYIFCRQWHENPLYSISSLNLIKRKRKRETSMVTNNKQTVLEFVRCLVTEYILESLILILFEEKQLSSFVRCLNSY